MLNFHRAGEILARLVPSVPPVPPDLDARVDVAFHTHHTTPTPAASAPAGVGHTPEGEDGSPAAATALGSEPQQRRTSPSGPPTGELFQSEPVHPAFRYELDDRRIASWLSSWATEEQA